MLHIFYGRENVNRDRMIFDRCNENTILLVPDQYTLQAERDALHYMQTKGLLGTEVLSFSRLGAMILKEAGGDRCPMIDKYGRHMILARIMEKRRRDLPLYGAFAGSTPFLEMLNNFISQMKQYGATPMQLKDVIDTMEDDRDYLKRKLTEIQILFEDYEAAIDGRYVDTEDMIALQCQRAPLAESLKTKTIVVYGFDYFTPGNLQLLTTLMQVCPQVEVYLTCGQFDPSANMSEGELLAACPRDGNVFALGHMMQERLLAIAKDIDVKVQVTAIDAKYRMGEEKSKPLRFLEQNLFALPCDTSEDYDGITLVRAANYYAEAETAAKEVKRLVNEENYRYRDIVLICNDLTTRGSIIRRVFAGYGINLFVDKKRNVLHNPAVAFSMLLLATVTGGYRRRDVVDLLKTGLLDVSRDAVETFENYCDAFHIDGSRFKRPFDKFKKEKDRLAEAEAEAEVEQTRQTVMDTLLAFDGAFKEAKSAKDKAVALYKYLEEEVKLPQKMENLIEQLRQAGESEIAEETAQVWNVTMNLLDQLAFIGGEEPMGRQTFRELFEAGMADVEIGILPPTLDGVTLGTMERTRCGRVKAVFVLGANEGILPAGVMSQDMLTEEEKAYLDEKKVALCKMDRLRAMEEDMAIYRNLTRATERLYVSCSASDEEGGKLAPSSIYEKIKEMFTVYTDEEKTATAGIEEQPDVENQGKFAYLVGGEQSTLEHLGRYLKRSVSGGKRTEQEIREADPLEPEAAEAVLWFMENRKETAMALEAAVNFRNVAGPLKEVETSALYKREEMDYPVVSPSELEKYGRCPFAHFVSYGLRPEEQKEYTMQGRDMGNVYHEVLDKFAKEMTEEGVPIGDKDSPWMTMTQEGISDLLDTVTDEVLAHYRGGLLMEGEKESYRIARMRRVLHPAVEAAVRQVRAGKLTAIKTEVAFGKGGSEGLPPVTLEVPRKEGEEPLKVSVRGQIDRVDLLDGNIVKVIDYKSWSESYNEAEARSGWKMQLFMYLLAAAGLQREPVGAFYFPLQDKVIDADKISAKKRETMEELQEAVASKIKEEMKMNGVMIGRQDVVEAIAGEDMDEAVHVKEEQSESGELSYKGEKGLSVLTEDQFQDLLDSVQKKATDIAGEIVAGKMDIVPLKQTTGRKRSACYYCDYKGICKFDLRFPENNYVMIQKDK